MPTCPDCRRRYPDGVNVCEADGETLLPDVTFRSDSALEPSRQVGEYRIESKLGQGGFGSVYAAVHPVIGKRAAIKVLDRAYSSNPQMVSRFVAEARAANTIRSSNIVDIFAFGALDDGRHYYVMELCEGLTLEARLHDHGPLDPSLLVHVLRGVGRALDAAHDAGIVHRDLKPDNVFITFGDDGNPVAKLLDFGIAKLISDDASAAHRTRTGAPVGTPHYMSPEQVKGEPVDRRSDVYSFGVMAFEALTGELPFKGPTMRELMNQHADAEAPRPSAVRPELGGAYDDAFARMLAKDPAARPARVGDAVSELTRAATAAGVDTEHPPILSPEERLPQRRSGQLTPEAVADTEIDSADTGLGRRESTGVETAPHARSIPPRPARGPQIAVFVAACALAVAAAAYAVVGPRSGSSTTAAPRAPAPRPCVAAPARSLPLPPSPPLPSASSSASHDAAAPMASLMVHSPVAGAIVELDGRELGVAPGPFRVPTDPSPHRLTVRAPGYVPYQRSDLVVAADVEVTARLIQVRRREKPEYQEPDWGKSP